MYAVLLALIPLGQVQQQERVVRNVKQRFEILLDLVLVGDALGDLAGVEQTGQRGKVCTLAAVVTEGADLHVLHLFLHAGLHGVAQGAGAVVVLGVEGVPGPHTAQIPQVLFFDLLVDADKGLVLLLIPLVVVPVHQGGVLGHQVGHVLLHHGLGVAVTVAVGGKAHRHIAGHQHGFVAVLACDLAHPGHVALEHLQTGAVAVELQVLAPAQQLRLVHGHTDDPAVKALGAGGDHSLDQFVGALVPAQQDVGAVVDLGIVLPAEDGSQMGQGVDLRHDLHAVGLGIGVEFLQFRLGVAAAGITEIGVTLYLIRILGIDGHGVVTHGGKGVDPPFQSVHRHNGVAGAIHAYCKSLKGNSIHVNFSFFSCASKMPMILTT